MVTGSILVSAQGAHDLHKIGRRLQEAGRDDLRKILRKHIRDAGKPVVADLKRAVMGVNVTRSDDPFARESARTGVPYRRSTSRWGRRSTGLRMRVAAATGLSQTRKGVRIRVSEKRFGGREAYSLTLPRYLDTEAARKYRHWRHPVYGNREVWVEQRGEPWFFVTIAKHQTRFRNAIADGIAEMERELDR